MRYRALVCFAFSAWVWCGCGDDASKDDARVCDCHGSYGAECVAECGPICDCREGHYGAECVPKCGPICDCSGSYGAECASKCGPVCKCDGTDGAECASKCEPKCKCDGTDGAECASKCEPKCKCDGTDGAECASKCEPVCDCDGDYGAECVSKCNPDCDCSRQYGTECMPKCAPLCDCYGDYGADCDAKCAGVCGNGKCEAGETTDTCPDDCGQTTYEPVTMEEFGALAEMRLRFLYDYERVIAPAAVPEDSTAKAKAKAMADNLADFFAFPYPSALRTDAHGRVRLDKFEIPVNDTLLAMLSSFAGISVDVEGILQNILDLVQTERAGSPAIGGVYFRTSAPIDADDLPSVFDTARPDSCFQLIDVEPDSSHYGERYPVYVTYHGEADSIWAENTIVMRPVPGVGPHPGDRMLAIIGDCLVSDGKPLRASRKMQYILRKVAPKEIGDRLGFYVDAIQKLSDDGELGMAIGDIRAFSGYATSNPATEMDQIAADLKGKGEIVANANGVAVGRFADHGTYYSFTGTFRTVSYMSGSYPYDGDGEGRISFDEEGRLTSVGHLEPVEFTVTIPKKPMPAAGYPIAVYGHGTGGDSTSHFGSNVDEAPSLYEGDVPIAMIGFDAVMHGKRELDANGNAYPSERTQAMALKNTVAVRESWRQTVADMLVLYDLIGRGELVLPPLPDASSGTGKIIFDPSYGLFMGHSQGAQEGGLLLGLTGDVHHAVLSAGAGGILLAFVDRAIGDTIWNLGIPAQYREMLSGMGLENMKVADVLAMFLGLGTGALSYDAFITDHIVQALVDPLDPLNYTHRFIREPLSGMSPKNILQTIGIGDRDSPNSGQFAMITAEGLEPVGVVYEVSDAMRIAGYTDSKAYCAADNIEASGGRVTGGSLQFTLQNTEIDPHFVIYYNVSARNAYVDFFQSVLAGEPQICVSGQAEP